MKRKLIHVDEDDLGLLKTVQIRTLLLLSRFILEDIKSGRYCRSPFGTNYGSMGGVWGRFRWDDDYKVIYKFGRKLICPNAKEPWTKRGTCISKKACNLFVAQIFSILKSSSVGRFRLLANESKDVRNTWT